MNKRINAILIFILLFVSKIFCDDKVFRESYELKLSINENQYYSWNVPESPYFVNQNVLQIYPNEEVFIEVINKGNQIEEMKVVKENVNPERTIIINFNQITKSENDKIHDYMMLKITNPFNSTLNYECLIFLLNHNKWVKTDVYPIPSLLSSYEIWPDVILSLVLQNFTLSE